MIGRWFRREPDPTAPTLSTGDLRRLADELAAADDADTDTFGPWHNGTPDGETPWWKTATDDPH